MTLLRTEQPHPAHAALDTARHALIGEGRQVSGLGIDANDHMDDLGAPPTGA